MFIRIITKLTFFLPLITGLLLLGMWHLTTPSSVGPFGILIVFVLLYVFFTSILLVLLRISRRLLVSLGLMGRADNRRLYYVASVLGFVPVLYLTLVSMGQVSIWGIVLIVIFIGLAVFYILRRS